MITTLISAGPFSRLVGISPRRFGQRRLRERSAADIAASMGDNDFIDMPVTPTPPGIHGRFDAFDAAKLRAVLELERAGLSFAAACLFIRSCQLSPLMMFPREPDHFARQWTLPDGAIRRISGTAQEIARATPEGSLASVSINLSACREYIAWRAMSQLGLNVAGTNFVESAQ